MSEHATGLVLGYDRTPASRHALQVATDLAARLDAHLHVVHVVDLRDYLIDPDSWKWEAQGRAQLDAEFEELKAGLTSWTGRWSYHLERGDPVTALASVATSTAALMIIVGTRGHGFGPALQRLINGSPSVSHRLEGAGTPVLVVAHPPAEPAPDSVEEIAAG